jgi:FkbM family methyltransferase
MHTIKKLKNKFHKGLLTKSDFINEAMILHQSLFEYIDIINNSDISNIQISNKGVLFVHKDNGIRMYCPRNEGRVVPIEVMNFGSYEKSETIVMDALLEGLEYIIDIGANIGWHTIRFAKRDSSAKIFSFEPMPISYSFLKKNIAENLVIERVTCYNYGLSDKNANVKLFISPGQGTNASIKNVSASKKSKLVDCQMITLDEWVLNHQIYPDFIKCDVEGAELLVFRGGKQTLSKSKPVIFTELLRKWSKPFGYHPNDMINYFANIGYICFAIGSSSVRKIKSVNDDTIETNYVFLNTKKHNKQIDRIHNLVY